MRKRRVVVAALVAAAAVVLLILLLTRGGGEDRAGRPGSSPRPTRSPGAATAVPSATSEEQFLPGSLQNYVYQSPPQSTETREELARMTGAETALRLLVPKSAELGFDILTLIVARYPADSPQHTENLHNLLENPAAPAKTRKVAGQSVSVVPGQAATPTQPARPPAALWRRDLRVDVFLSGGTEEQLLDVMGELIRGGG